MKTTLFPIIALATLLAACGKGDSHTSSTSSSMATVNFQAVTSGTAASITFDALSSDLSKSLLSDKVTTFDVAGAGRAFSGLVQLAPGTYVFRAKAFDGSGAAIGEGLADNGNPITLVKGQRTSISITVSASAAATATPVITSFVASPTGPTVMVGTPITLTATVQGTGPMTYKWSQNAACLHGAFSTATNGTSATWSNSAEETCTLTFTATDTGTGLTDSRSITIQCSCLAPTAGMALTACP